MKANAYFRNGADVYAVINKGGFVVNCEVEIPTDDLIAELEKRRPCERCEGMGKVSHMPCQNCLWNGVLNDDNFKEAHNG